MGSLSVNGMANLLRHMPAACELTPSSVFLDLGSATGAVPLFVRAATGVHSIGIEIDRCRHWSALRRYGEVRGELPSGLEYVNADVRATGLRNATHLFMHSTCFGASLTRAIVALADKARVRCIIDGGKADVRPELEAWGVPVAVAKSSFSWARGGSVPLYYYARRGLPGAEQRLAIDAKTRELWRERAKLATFGLSDGCGNDDEDPVMG